MNSEPEPDAPPQRYTAAQLAIERREYNRAKATIVPVDELMDTPDGADERYDDEAYGRCPDCETVFRKREGSWHRCGGERRYYEGEQ